MFSLEYTNFITNETITLAENISTLNEAYSELFTCIDNESDTFDISFYSIHGDDGSLFFQDGDTVRNGSCIYDLSNEIQKRINHEKEKYNVCTN